MEDQNQNTIEESFAETIAKGATQVTDELILVNQGNYSPIKAAKMAAFTLKLQLDMLDILADSEARFRVFKNAIEFEEAKAYFDCKKADGKHTENSLKHSVVLAEQVVKAKTDLIDAEKDLKKWQNLYSLLKESHIFFRNFSHA